MCSSTGIHPKGKKKDAKQGNSKKHTGTQTSISSRKQLCDTLTKNPGSLTTTKERTPILLTSILLFKGKEPTIQKNREHVALLQRYLQNRSSDKNYSATKNYVYFQRHDFSFGVKILHCAAKTKTSFLNVENCSLNSAERKFITLLQIRRPTPQVKVVSYPMIPN